MKVILQLELSDSQIIGNEDLGLPSDSQLRYVSQVALPQLLLVNVVVDVYGFLPDIASQLLDELPWHACAPEVCCEQVPAAVWREVVLHLV
jgi:hypothetical protein